MGTAVFPTLAGLGWDVKMNVQAGNTLIQESASGKENRATAWTSPRRTFTLTYEILDQVTAGDLESLAGFFMARLGSFDSFLFTFPQDNAEVAAQFGVGDNVTKTFQLARLFGTFVEPINAPNVVSHVYQNGVDTGGWSVDATTGIVTFSAAPPSSTVLTADFSFYFRSRFLEDAQDFNQFAANMWENRKVEFKSLK